MNQILIHFRKFDWLLTGAVFLLMGIGLLSLFSLSDVGVFPFFKRQVLWSAVGITLMIGASLVDFRIFRTQGFLVFLFYVGAVGLLALVLLSTAIRGVEGWFRFGSVLIQPVEFTKIVLIILFAKFFSKRHVEIYRVQHLLVSWFYLFIPLILVLAQPDLGSAIILVSIWVGVVLFSGMRLRHFFVLVAIGFLVGSLGWQFALEPYQKNRITAFLSPYEDPKGAGYQMIQSMIAVGSGQVWGKGIGYGSQSHLNFLPEAQTDFIFAAFAEEWGFVGVLVVLVLYLVLLWRIIVIGWSSVDNFSRLYALGFAAFIFVQSVIHIGMNMGLLPITGITLPFVSYGGSSLVALLIGVGILQNIKINSRKGIE